MTLLRDQKANEHLIDVIARGAQAHAEDAVRALAHFRHDARIKNAVLEAAAARADATVSTLVHKAFGPRT